MTGFNELTVSQRLGCEFLFNQPMQMAADCRVIEALDDFVEKAGDEETLGDFCRNAARAQVKHLVFFDLT